MDAIPLIKEQCTRATQNDQLIASSLAVYKATQANCMSNFLSYTPFEYLFN